MDWVRLYTDVLTHPKWMGLSDKSKAMLVQAWMYAGRHETGGYVPESAKRLIGWTPGADRECEGTWWHRNGSGWHLHDWEDHQAQVDEITEMRRRARDKKRAQRAEAKARQEES